MTTTPDPSLIYDYAAAGANEKELVAALNALRAAGDPATLEADRRLAITMAVEDLLGQAQDAEDNEQDGRASKLRAQARSLRATIEAQS